MPATYRKRYAGSFPTRADGHTVTVEIWLADNADTMQPETVGALAFPGTSPVTIERSYSGKEESVEGSTLTLKVLSPGDRTYADLYTIDPDGVRIDILLDGELYWRGLMDPETYEEPYQDTADYEVTIRATDFGVLSRKHWARRDGIISIGSIISGIMADAALGDLTFRTHAISSCTSPGVKLDLASIMVNAGNFYDSDGEGSTLDDVLRGILQPLGLHIRQHRGQLWIYDINGLHSLPAEEVYWSADTQTLGVDQVYNLCRVTFSPGVRTGSLLCDDDEYDLPPQWLLDESVTIPQLDPYQATADGTQWNCWTTFGTNNASRCDQEDNPGAVIMVRGPRPDDPVTVDTERGLRLMRIHSVNSGEDTPGIALVWPSMQFTQHIHDNKNHIYHCSIRRWGIAADQLFTSSTATGYIPPRSSSLHRLFTTRPVAVSPTDPQWLKITMEMLLDGRLNPWEQPHDINFYYWDNRTAQERISSWAWMLRVPVRILFRGVTTGRTWLWRHYNQPEFKTKLSDTYGRWIEVDDTGDDVITPHPVDGDRWSYLSYWENDRASQSPLAAGWKTNRPHITPDKDDLYESLLRAEGQYIRNPAMLHSEPGEVWIELLDSDWIAETSILGGGLTNGQWRERLFRRSILWILFKLPKIEPLQSVAPEVEPSDEDIVTEGVIHPLATEELEISTICGTPSGLSGALGAYILDGRALTSITRAGKSETPEELLIRTMLSNYGHRHTTLSGEMRIPATFGPLTDPCQPPSARFITGDSTEDLDTLTTEATIIEISPDNYVRRATDMPADPGLPPSSEATQDE